MGIENKMKNIAVFGGSFDPPHLGHEYVINQLCENNFLDEVWVMIIRKNHHRNKKIVSSDYFRKFLLCKIFKNNKKVKIKFISSYNNKNSQPVETAKTLSCKYGNYNFYYAMGDSDIEGIKDWNDSDYAINNMMFLIIHRNNIEMNIPVRICGEIEQYNKSISSSEIRKRLKNNEDISEFISNKIIKEIYDYKRYN
jgi:nicotinate-nucleotide adenylyltransferase